MSRFVFVYPFPSVVRNWRSFVLPDPPSFNNLYFIGYHISFYFGYSANEDIDLIILKFITFKYSYICPYLGHVHSSVLTLLYAFC